MQHVMSAADDAPVLSCHKDKNSIAEFTSSWAPLQRVPLQQRKQMSSCAFCQSKNTGVY